MSKILENLYLSPVTVAKDEKFFKTNKVTHVLIAAKGLKQYQKGVKYHQLDLVDNAGANIAKYFIESIKFIDEAVSTGNAVLVHCMGGVSRSSSIVIAYVMFKLAMTFEKAFDLVKGNHERTNPNAGFAAQLRQFEVCVLEYHQQSKLEEKEEINYKLLEFLIIENIKRISKKEKQGMEK